MGRNRFSQLLSLVVAGWFLTWLWARDAYKPFIAEPLDWLWLLVGGLIGAVGFLALVVLISPPLPPYMRFEQPLQRFPTGYLELAMAILTVSLGASIMGFAGSAAINWWEWLKEEYLGVGSFIGIVALIRQRIWYQLTSRLFRRGINQRAVTADQLAFHFFGFGSTDLEVIPEEIEFEEIDCNLSAELQRAWGIDKVWVQGVKFTLLVPDKPPIITKTVQEIQIDLVGWVRRQMGTLTGEVAWREFVYNPSEFLVDAGKERVSTGGLTYAFVTAKGLAYKEEV